MPSTAFRANLPAALLALLLAAPWSGAQESSPPACDDADIYHRLDFWVGDWDVYIGDELVGHNLIEKTLDGCAIFEHWHAVDGGTGKSLFFVDYDRRWAQIWVTQWARTPGGIKEKVMVDDPPPGSVRFQGVIRHPEAGAWLDRTTLTPGEDGHVRQLIEISRDNGVSWNTTFDATYRPADRAGESR